MAELKRSRRLVSFAGSSVEVDFTEGRAADIVGFLYGHTPADEAVSPHVTLRLREDPGTGRFSLYRGGHPCCEDASLGHVATWLLHVTCGALAGGSRRGLVLHAASVMWNGRALMLPGRSGAGKTTVAASLMSQHFTYLTDELTHVVDSPPRVEAFARPLRVHEPALGALEDRHQLMSRALGVMTSPDGVLVAPKGLGGGEPPRRVSLAAVVFPRYRAGCAFSLVPLSPARSALLLMEGLLNAQNFSDRGFDQVVQLASRLPAWEIHYGHLEQIERHLDAVKAVLRP